MNPMPPASSSPWLVVLLFLLGLAACADPEQPQESEPASGAAPQAPGTVAEVLADDDRLTTFVTALDSAGLTQSLREEGPFTVFAPTDSAFAALPDGTVDDLLLPEYRDRLITILTYHVVEGAHATDDLRKASSLPTIEGGDLSIRTEGETVRVGEATVIAPDRAAGDGVVHIIDAVLLPPTDEDAM